MKRIIPSLFLLIFSFVLAAPVLARQVEPAAASSSQLLPAALLLLLPLGFILLISSATPPEHAPSMAAHLMVGWSIAALAYFAAGFALHFGGIAQVTPTPDLQGLYWEWYPLGQAVELDVAQRWGVLALQGWALSGPAATPGAIQLFAEHVSLVGLAAMLPTAALLQRGRGKPALLMALLTGAVLYPLAGNWVWGGGWLAHAGISLELGHGLVDFGGAGVIFLTGSLSALVAMLIFIKPVSPEEKVAEPEEVVVPLTDNTRLTVYETPTDPAIEEEIIPPAPMPSAHLPILGLLGAGFSLMGWLGLATGSHAPTAVNFSPAQAAVGGVLAALSAMLAAALYSALTTRRIDPLMSSRGLTAGLIVAIAGAPFIPPWILALTGLVMGLLLPLFIYLLDQKTSLADDLGLVATYGLSAVISLILVGFFASGEAGQGWNGVGTTLYQSISQQGVSGLVVAAGYQPDWPGQIQAQLLGIAALSIFASGTSFLLLQTVKVIQNAWIRSGLELLR